VPWPKDLKTTDLTYPEFTAEVSVSQKYLCEKLGKIFENDLEDAVKNSDVIFISVSDNNIIEVAEEIVRKVDNDALRSKLLFI